MKSLHTSLTVALLIILIAACGPGETPTPAPTSTPLPPPTKTFTPEPTATAEPTPTVTPIYVEPETLGILENTSVSINDPLGLAQRFKGVGDVPPTVEPPAAPLEVGAKDTFWVIDYRDESFEVPATLHYVTDHAYFWIADDAQFEQSDLEKLGKAFENKIYQTGHAFFGSEWSPGIDGDPHIYVLFARRLGVYIAGYFSSADEMHPLAHEYSNAHEMFVLNIDNLDVGEAYTLSTLAHEFQHMIHWNLDRNETTWLNEGFSQLSELLNRYDVGGFDREYAGDPDLQLNTWSDAEEDNFRHYGASFLFVSYFLDRFGEQATQALVAHPANGLVSIDHVLQDLGAVDPITEEPISADRFVMDWAITNFIDDPVVADGRYTYINYNENPPFRQTETISDCEKGLQEREVHQYGVDYIRVICLGEQTLHFDGSVQTKLVPADPYSGAYAFWSNKGDSSDMTLTRTFNFTEHTGPITLTFQTWYDIEKDYDYAYVEASLDGEDWEILTTPSGTDKNPSGNSYGWGYTGKTRGSEWIEESVDLSQFAGQEVHIRFEYITDASLHGEGMLIDDVAIPEIDYFTDFEADDGGWVADGFVRVQNVLPQTFRLALITIGDTITVEHIPLGVNNLADIPLDLAEEGEVAVLVVVGTTRFTREHATYSFDFYR
ncbi:MAG: immune inhibitor A [Anaerolineaceae bacterium]|nr:MAG: immune inhibitor A [Anaerolineaceae bacterium]